MNRLAGRVAAATLWSLLFSLAGLRAGALRERYDTRLHHGVLPLLGLLLALAAYHAVKRRGWLPGVRQGPAAPGGAAAEVFAGTLIAVVLALAGGVAGLALMRALQLGAAMPVRRALPVLAGLGLGLLGYSWLDARGWLPWQRAAAGGTQRGGTNIAVQVCFAVLWFIAIITLSVVVMQLLAALGPRQLLGNQALTKLGSDLGAVVFSFLLCFGRLPGARRRRGGAALLGPWAAVQAMAGFAMMIAAGAIAVLSLLLIEQLGLLARHSGLHVNFADSNALIVSALAGELVAALWIAWFLRGLGAALVTDGGSGGVGWRAASREAYLTAALAAAVIILAASILYHFVPPDMNALKNLPDEKMFEHPGALALPLLILFVVFGPVLEEVVFRGVAFGGLAARLGPVWAGVISTALFVALHAPEKIHYPPGFADVAAMAAASCWLRVRFGSIRPGMLLHMLYNGGLLLASGAMQ